MGIGREILRDIGELILGNSKEAGQFLDAIETVADNVTNSVKKMFSHKSGSSDDDYEYPYIEFQNDKNPLDELYDRYKDESSENIVDALYSNDNEFSNEKCDLLYGILTEERHLSNDEIQIIRFRNKSTFDLLFNFYDTENSDSIKQILKNVIVQSRNLQESDFRLFYINGFKDISVEIFQESETAILPDNFNQYLASWKNSYNLNDSEIKYIRHQTLKTLKIKTKANCLLFAVLLGFFGGHRFYVKKNWSGLAYVLLTSFIVISYLYLVWIDDLVILGLFFLTVLCIVIDITRILSSTFKDKDGNYIVYWTR